MVYSLIKECNWALFRSESQASLQTLGLVLSFTIKLTRGLFSNAIELKIPSQRILAPPPSAVWLATEIYRDQSTTPKWRSKFFYFDSSEMPWFRRLSRLTTGSRRQPRRGNCSEHLQEITRLLQPRTIGFVGNLEPEDNKPKWIIHRKKQVRASETSGWK